MEYVNVVNNLHRPPTNYKKQKPNVSVSRKNKKYNMSLFTVKPSSKPSCAFCSDIHLKTINIIKYVLVI